MKATLISLLFVALPLQAAGLPRSASSVEIIKEKNLLTYENFPRIAKVFVGERNNTQTDELEATCQKWVFDQIQKKEAPYFRAWCTRTKDIVLREYRYTGNLLIKNW